MRVEIEIEAGSKTFASGLLADLIDAVRRSRPGGSDVLRRYSLDDLTTTARDTFLAHPDYLNPPNAWC
jgi:hypothetical protein